MSDYTQNFPKLSTYDFDTIMCQLKQVCGADPSGLINAQFLSRPTTAKDIALLLHITYELFKSQVELQKQFVELYTFVKDFFENLDLQEEVNKWLNENINEEDITNAVNNRFAYVIPPLSANSDIAQLIYENCRSYMENKNNMCYMHLYDEGGNNNACNYEKGAQKTTNPRTGYAGYPMNCSCFVSLILWGVDYYHSMMTPEFQLNNLFGSAGYCFNIYGESLNSQNYNLYRNTKEMVAQFAKLGLCEKVNEDFYNIHAGDVVFFYDTTEFPEPSFDNVHHCGIVVSSIRNGSNSKFIYADFREDGNNRDNELTFHDFNITVASNINLMPCYVCHPRYMQTQKPKIKKIGDFTQTSSGTFNLPAGYKDHVLTAVCVYESDTSVVPGVYINDVHYSQYDLPRISSTELSKKLKGITTFKTYANNDGIKIQFNNFKQITLFDGVLTGEVGEAYRIEAMNDFLEAVCEADVVYNVPFKKEFDALLMIPDIISGYFCRCNGIINYQKTYGYVECDTGNLKVIFILNNGTWFFVISTENFTTNNTENYPSTYRTFMIDALLDNINCTVLVAPSYMLFITSQGMWHVNKQSGYAVSYTHLRAPRD